MTSAGSSAPGSRLGVDEQAEQHEQADLGQPGQPVGEATGWPRRCGSRALPSTTPAR